MPLPWFRLYSELLEDKKLKRLAHLADQDILTMRGFWCSLLCLANDSPERGVLLFPDGVAMSCADVAEEIGMDADQCITMMELFARDPLCLLENYDGKWRITNWDKRQFKSDNAAERARRWRESQSDDDGNETSDDEQSENVQETFNERSASVFCTLNSDISLNSVSVSKTGEERIKIPSSDSRTEDRKANNRLHDAWDAHLVAICADGYAQLAPQIKQQVRLVGRDKDIWLLEHNERVIEWLKGRVPVFWETFTQTVRFVPP